MTTWLRACGVAAAALAIGAATALPAAACPKRHAARHRVVHHKVVRKWKPAHVAFHRAPRTITRTVVVNHTVYVPGPERVVYRDREVPAPEPRFHVREPAVVVEREPVICRDRPRDAVRVRFDAYREPGYYLTARHVRAYREEVRHVRYRERDCR